MANYNVTVKVIRGWQDEIETLIQDYLNGIDSSKAIRSIACLPYGSDGIICVIITDA
jgi:hypothetical protein